MPWQLQLPELTYPLTIDTIGKELASGLEVSMNCHECGRQAVRINLVQIAKRHGMDYPSGHNSLLKVVSCSACRDAGRPRKNITFICHQITAKYSNWPREAPKGGEFIFQRV